MDVSGYQLHRRYAPVLGAVQQIVDQAAFLVQQRMRERMAPTRIVVAARKHCPEVVEESQQRTLGVRAKPLWREGWANLGMTVLSPEGVLVVIDAGAAKRNPQHWLPETVVHELVHAVQFGRPGVREIALKGLRNNYGIEKLSHPKAWKINRLVDRDEREAQALESLARQIR
ncbi:hypothetical protein ACFV9E_06325 [Streptomyces sp. NPDC059835]|uniref:hypothetical protein n=1 Tax=Streptomyces sp. NPDC059835 TaxID=3346967 RepID=UPI003669C7B4